MRVLTRFRFRKALQYRLYVVGVCLAYLLVALEIPLPVFVHKDSSQPFPCQDHACGCRTAEQCWRSCCCFTAEQRLTWARAHDVQPPTYAEKPAVQGWNTVKLRDRVRESSAKSCCRAKAERASCCKPVADSRSESGRVRWATTMDSWRCQGYSTLWVAAGAVLLVSPLAAWVPDWTSPTRIALPSLYADTIPTIPPDPPPRLFLV
jgi:hypothetical protein